jgi:glycogen debranching enzyme
MTETGVPGNRAVPDLHAITLSGDRLENRTFLLGDDAGFVLYLPVMENRNDRTLQSIKWFGASEFGRKYLEGNLLWVTVDGEQVALNRGNQIGFVQYLDRAARTFRVNGVMITQTFFLPSHLHSVVMTLEADRHVTFTIEPEFDMRYYQEFNTDFTGYASDVVNGDTLAVSNRIERPSGTGAMQFYASIRPIEGTVSLSPLSQNERLRRKTYRKDELRLKLIHSSYTETHEVAPDEAPIWDEYSTTVYAPARFQGERRISLIYAFDDTERGARDALDTVAAHLAAERRSKVEAALALQRQAALETGVDAVDTAYAQVLARFDSCLVARDVTIDTGEYSLEHWYAIFAGNKYFLDAWKRDENICLIGLLLSSQYQTVRAILDETWTHQDEKTGRLPQIIRVGQPLVYFSSDGTLWALRRLHQYTRVSGDRTLLDQKYGMVERFFQASLSFVRRGLLPSGGIVDKTYLWETWEDTPYTPRSGYPVEIELLWLTALRDYLPVVRDRNPQLAARMEAALEEGNETFCRFYLDGYLADSLSYDWEPQTILTPNGYLAFDLGYPLPATLRSRMVEVARDQLAGRVGVRSLASRDWSGALSKEFMADQRNFEHGQMASVGIYNYHRGIEWLWLNPFLLQGELTCGDTEIGYRRYVAGEVHSTLTEMGVGGLSELYDIRGPLGADFQAWSMTGFLASLHAFAGIEVDALARTIQIRPSIPASWPHLTCRRRVAYTVFDLRYTCGERGEQAVEVVVQGEAPNGYSLDIGVRVPDGRRVDRVLIGDEAVPDAAVRREEPCGAGRPGEAWVRTSLQRQVAVTFSLGG